MIFYYDAPKNFHAVTDKTILVYAEMAFWSNICESFSVFMNFTADFGIIRLLASGENKTHNTKHRGNEKSIGFTVVRPHRLSRWFGIAGFMLASEY